MTDEHHGEAEGWRRFVPPWWTLGFPLLAAAGLAAWQAANAGDDPALTVFVSSLLWPGAVAFAIVLVFVVLGWALDID
jgi:hypothetical protein